MRLARNVPEYSEKLLDDWMTALMGQVVEVVSTDTEVITDEGLAGCACTVLADTVVVTDEGCAATD